jgi:hypothetical protein
MKIGPGVRAAIAAGTSAGIAVSLMLMSGHGGTVAVHNTATEAPTEETTTTVSVEPTTTTTVAPVPSTTTTTAPHATTTTTTRAIVPTTIGEPLVIEAPTTTTTTPPAPHTSIQVTCLTDCFVLIEGYSQTTVRNMVVAGHVGDRTFTVTFPEVGPAHIGHDYAFTTDDHIGQIQEQDVIIDNLTWEN